MKNRDICHNLELLPEQNLSNRAYRAVCIALVIFCLIAITNAAIAKANPRIYIGVLAYRGFDQTEIMWEPTATYLSRVIPEFDFQIVPVTNDNAAHQIADKKLHFIIVNPALYTKFEADYGISRIATLINFQLGKKYTNFGAVIFTQARRNDIFGLKDLAGKSFMAVHEDAFGGWWMAWREFRKNGIDPYRDFSEISYSGFPHDDVVRAVKQGKVDAGTVRTGVLENMASSGKINLSEFKILSPKLTPDFPFAHSTPLYPEWAIAATRNISPHIAKKVSIALLSLDGNSQVARAADSSGWTIPLDYTPVHDLMRELNVGPYKISKKINYRTFIKEHTFTELTILIVLLSISWALLAVTKKKLLDKSSSIENQKQIIFALNNQISLEQVHSRRIVSLLKITVNNSLSDKEKIQALLEKGCHYFGMDLAAICEVNPVTRTFVVVQYYKKGKMDSSTKNVYDLNNSFTGVCLNYSEPLIINDISNSDLKNHDHITPDELKSYIGTSLFLNDKPFGTLEFFSYSLATSPNNNAPELLRVFTMSFRTILANLYRHYPGRSLATR